MVGGVVENKRERKGRMKERPILFNTSMVKAILEGRKTQTRRPLTFKDNPFEEVPYLLSATFDDELLFGDSPNIQECFAKYVYKNPYCVGNRLWVRETLADVNSEMGPTLLYKDGCMIGWEDFSTVFGKDYGVGPSFNYDKYPGLKNDWTVWYSDIDLKCGSGGRWTPSIHMPRWASRITLEITDIRIERIKAITREDAIAEGIKPYPELKNEHKQFKRLWRQVYGEEAWTKNPWVFAIEFKVLNKESEET